MQQAVTNSRLIIRRCGAEPREIPLSTDISIGRAHDNLIAVEDSRVSRYHAVVELRRDGIWLCDLGSVNGTELNGACIESECRLKDGDSIKLGDVTVECRIQDGSGGTIGWAFSGDAERHRRISAKRAPGASSDSSTEPGGASRRRPFAEKRIGLIALAVAVPVVAIIIAAAVWTGFLSHSAKDYRSIHIIGVSNGDTITKPTVVRTDVNSTADVLEVVYQLDGVELARTKTPPFSAEINPGELLAKRPELATSTHVLSLVVQDKAGDQSVQPVKVILSFRPSGANGADSAGAGNADSGAGGNSNASAAADGAPPTANDVAYMADGLARQISRKNQVFAPELVQAIMERTNVYRFDFTDGVRGGHPREIANAFSNRGIDPIVGFVLAMSQGSFRPGSGSGDARLWRLPPAVVKDFSSKEDSAGLPDAKRSAETAAEYTKSLMGLFEPEDFMYAIGCFGMTISQAGEVRARLHQNLTAEDRREFWKAVQSGILSRESTDRVVSFFAAGIVAEYPDKFGLHCAPLPNLY